MSEPRPVSYAVAIEVGSGIWSVRWYARGRRAGPVDRRFSPQAVFDSPALYSLGVVPSQRLKARMKLLQSLKPSR